MRVTILNLDGVPDSVGDTFDGEGLEIPEELPVTLGVRSNMEHVVGKAKITKETNRVVADIQVVESLPGAEGVKRFTPAVGGFITERSGDRIVKARIDTLMLVMERNADFRIKPIWEQLVEQEALMPVAEIKE